jgi:hypothetical protein
MESGKITLLMQLVGRLKENFDIFKKAYENSDKENFDISKKAILETQEKINFLIKK